MTSASEKRKEDRYIYPGTRVRLDSFVNDADETTPEYGIVVHCWENTEYGFFDCYVAFFGDGFPQNEPSEKPYILRYSAAVLTTLLD